ncbi:dynein light chain Tctex-type 5-like [Galleria mellonella]|uniref:Dynein light chain Tctex-type 5-like n=1 Tax=Galleria mellonella TaxID=7137 RepID=A0A6J1WYP6_GALME|nr:dynein light chain Tctex-type 5-like [Galleria mellonella]
MGEPEGKKSKVSMMLISQSQSRSIAGMKSMSRMKVRRASFGFTGVPGIRPVERTSQLGIEFKRPPQLYLNTYQLDPYVKFHIPTVKFATDAILDEYFTEHKYNVQESPAIALRIAGELMRRVKTMPFNRYRIITVVTIGQKRAQSYNNAVSFLWDYERDNYVDVQREVATAFIQVTTFGIYLD